MKKLICGVFLFLTACAPIPAELPVVAEPVSRDQAASAPAKKKIILNADRILTVLGEPTVKRFEAPAEVWVYSQPSCVLFIYMNAGQGRPSRVRHMEIGTPSFGVSEKQSAACLALASRLR